MIVHFLFDYTNKTQIFFPFVVLGVGHRASCMLGNLFITELYPQPHRSFSCHYLHDELVTMKLLRISTRFRLMKSLGIHSSLWFLKGRVFSHNTAASIITPGLSWHLCFSWLTTSCRGVGGDDYFFDYVSQWQIFDYIAAKRYA